MPIPHNLRNRILTAAFLAVILASAPRPAHAASKEIIELQTQVQQLLDQMQRLQSTMDAKFGVMQHLVEQTADNTNQMSVAVNALQQKINAQNDAGSGKLDTVSGQVQSLNDSVDELKSRIAKLDKSIQDLQAQLQNVQSPPSGAGQSGTPGGAPEVSAPSNGSPSAASPGAAVPQMSNQMSNQAPPLAETFQAGVHQMPGRHSPHNRVIHVGAGDFRCIPCSGDVNDGDAGILQPAQALCA